MFRQKARIIRTAFAALLLFFVMSSAAKAQTAGGTLQGAMTDASGAVIPGGQVIIRNVATGITRTVTTNEAGIYRAPSLAPGNYEITAAASGFSTQTVSGIVLTVGAEQVVNIAMKLGAVGEKVEVQAGAPAVELESSMLSHVVNEKTIQELPLNGRDWTQLATLQPGVAVIRSQDTSDVNRAQRGNGIQMTISGGRPSENNYRLNGISINDYANTGPGSSLGVNLGVDAIQEFSVLTSTFSAEYGRTAGGVINAITRSGSNALHGSAYYFHRNSALDARNFFDTTQSPLPFRRHQYGGSVGGPIKHDKTFFFVDYEELREFLSQTNISNVPSVTARTGNLSTGKVNVLASVVPFLALYPLPNGPLAKNGDTGVYTYPGARDSHEEFVTGKVDHRFNEKDSLNVTYLFDNAQITAPDEFANKLLSYPSRRQDATLEETHLFSPSLINSLRLGYSRTVAGEGLSEILLNQALKNPALGFIPGLPVGRIQVASLSNFSGGPGAVDSNLFAYNSFQEYDDLFITRGRHSIKLGGGVERIQDNFNAANTPEGNYVFGSLASFLQGAASQLQAQLPGSDTVRGTRQTVFGTYVQDDFHFRPNLTINLGLRYEIATVPNEVNGKTATLRSPTDPQVTVGKLFNNNTFKDFAPRVGFAWDPFSDGKTSVRAGFGMFDILPLAYIFVNRFPRTPPFFEVGFAGNPPPSTFPSGAFALLGPTSFRTIYIEQHPRRSYKMQWNLTVQRELSKTLAVTIGYVGARGVHLAKGYEDIDIVLPTLTPNGYLWPVNATANQRINTNFGRIAAHYWNVDSYYQAMQFAVKKTLGHGLQFQASYTWAKSIDDGSNTFSDNEYINSIGDPYGFDPRLNRGLSDFDLRHALSINYLYEIPTPDWSKAAKAIVGGWQFGGILTAQTGNPFTVILAGDRANTRSSQSNAFLGERPNFTNGPGCSDPINAGNPNQYVKLSCFTYPVAGTLGNLGRNTIPGPGLLNLDFSLFKNIPVPKITEAFRAQFRSEFFNVLNHTNFALPDVTRYAIIDNTGHLTGNAGQLFRTQTPSRQIQFGLKLSW